MRSKSQDYKTSLELLGDEYQEARDTEFTIQFQDEFGDEFNAIYKITEDDLQGFLDSFTFPDEDQWCVDEYERRLANFNDAKYEAFKDERYED